MNLLLVASEAVPFIKVGGLADVTGALAEALRARGHRVVLVLPRYSRIDVARFGFQPLLDRVGVATGVGTLWCRVLGATSASGVETWLVEYDDLYGRSGVYDENRQAYADNGERFVFHSLASLQACRDLSYRPDVIHCHDWPTAMLPALLKARCGDDPTLALAGSVLTVHNLAHQGRFPARILRFADLPPQLFDRWWFEDHGQVNMLKGGMATADLITTVSPTYANEILSPIGGSGLQDVLARRRHDLHGILNGVDLETWNPETDPLLPARYSVADRSGKRVCKARLQADLGLDLSPDAPVFGVVSRLDYQKGLDLVRDVVGHIVERGGQFVILGAGDEALKAGFTDLRDRWPSRVGVDFSTWNEGLAHRIMGGSDFFLMPSRFEPCGLTQMYALRYGSVPIVRSTGGLVDTVEDAASPHGVGFRFDDMAAWALHGAVDRALDTWYMGHGFYEAMVERGMTRSFTWEAAARRYEEVYAWAISKRKWWRNL